MFRVLIFSLILLLCSQVCATEPVVLKNYGDAITMMQKHNAPGIVIFTADWCAPCKRLRKETLTPIMPSLSKNFVVYIVNVDKEPKVAESWRKVNRLKDLPSYHLLSRGGKRVIGSGSGFIDKVSFVKWGNGIIANWKRSQAYKQHL